jgi:hypothetical protein
MKKMIAALAVSMMGLSSTAYAETALEWADRIDACDGAPILAAEILDDGRLKVLCPFGAVPGAAPVGPAGVAGVGGAGGAAALGAGAGLGTSATVALVAAGIVLVIAAGDDDAVSTTTTTATGS